MIVISWVCLVGDFFTDFQGKSPSFTTIWEKLFFFFQAFFKQIQENSQLLLPGDLRFAIFQFDLWLSSMLGSMKLWYIYLHEKPLKLMSMFIMGSMYCLIYIYTYLYSQDAVAFISCFLIQHDILHHQDLFDIFMYLSPPVNASKCFLSENICFGDFCVSRLHEVHSLYIQTPPEKVFGTPKHTLNTFSEGIWISRD